MHKKYGAIYKNGDIIYFNDTHDIVNNGFSNKSKPINVLVNEYGIIYISHKGYIIPNMVNELQLTTLNYVIKNNIIPNKKMWE